MLWAEPRQCVWTGVDPVNLLIQAVASGEEPDRRAKAIETLARLQRIPTKVIPSLIRATKDKDAGVRLAAVQALAHVQDNSVFSALVDLLQADPDPEVKRGAIRAVGKI